MSSYRMLGIGLIGKLGTQVRSLMAQHPSQTFPLDQVLAAFQAGGANGFSVKVEELPFEMAGLDWPPDHLVRIKGEWADLTICGHLLLTQNTRDNRFQREFEVSWELILREDGLYISPWITTRRIDFAGSEKGIYWLKHRSGPGCILLVAAGLVKESIKLEIDMSKVVDLSKLEDEVSRRLVGDKKGSQLIYRSDYEVASGRSGRTLRASERVSG